MAASTFFPGMISTPAEPSIPIVYEDSATDERSLRYFTRRYSYACPIPAYPGSIE